MSAKQTPESFWSRVDKTDTCWNWTGSKTSSGYGSVGWNGRVYVAHRVAAFLSGMVPSMSAPGSPKEGHVLHRCDNRACCRPDHFFIGSYSDNQRDAYVKARKVQPRGSAHANAKMSTAVARTIRSAYAKGGISQQRLANLYGVSQIAVSLLVRGITYRDAI